MDYQLPPNDGLNHSIQNAVQNFPWNLLPSEKELPTADLGTRKTTTFLDSPNLARILIVLREFKDRLCKADPTFDESIGNRLLRLPRTCMLLKLLKLEDRLAHFLSWEDMADWTAPEDGVIEHLVGVENATIFEFERHRTMLLDFRVNQPNIYKEKQIIPVRTIQSLGHGGWAQVDCVENVITGARLARKRFTLRKAPAAKLKQSCETEIASLRKLNGHQHIIQYLCSYETERSLNLLLSPVADCNLYEYLCRDDFELGNRTEILEQSLGCIASALDFIHRHKIRHKDVKSQNILLYHHNGETKIIVTDFGISFDFSLRDNSVTEGVTHKTRKYCAPEVARDGPRGRRSDVFSLGCIYLEILTVLAGKTMDELEDYIGDDTNYFEAQDEIHSWIQQLSDGAAGVAYLALGWCKVMIQRRPADRPYIDQVIDLISFHTKGRPQLRRKLFCKVCLSELRVRNLITAEANNDDDDDSRSDSTDYEDEHKEPKSDPVSQSPLFQWVPSQQLQKSSKELPNNPRGYHTISVHVIFVIRRFESCLRGLLLLTKSLRSNSLADAEIAIIRLEYEFLMLTNWGSVVGLFGNRLQLSNDFLNDQHAILNVLLQQQTIVESCWKKPQRDDSLIFAQPSANDTPPKLPTSALTVISSIQPVDRVEELTSNRGDLPPTLTLRELHGVVDQLATKNEDLKALLSESGKRDLDAKDEKENAQLLQLYDTFEDLISLVKAVGPSYLPIDSKEKCSPADEISKSERIETSIKTGTSTKENLARYAHLKAINISSKSQDLEERNDGHEAVSLRLLTPSGLPETLSTNDLASPVDGGASIHTTHASPLSLMLDPYYIKWEENQADEASRVSAQYCPSGAPPQDVWIEWKEDPMDGPMSLIDGADPMITHRVTSLAALLHDHQKPLDLRIPHCIGVIRDEDEMRYGLVFEQPGNHGLQDFELSRYRRPPVSLLDLLRQEKIQAPALHIRIALMNSIAEAVGRFHAVKWLHKGLRSDNIVFFDNYSNSEAIELGTTTGDLGVTLAKYSLPYITGFEYSRPARSDDMTEQPLQNPSHDIYRHPMIQSQSGRDDGRNSYKEIHDIYSLGIILIEIAEWQPIDRILGIDLDVARPKDLWTVRSKLLDKDRFQTWIQFSSGRKIANAIFACIIGSKAFEADTAGDETIALDDVKVQETFHSMVVKPLSDLAGVL